MKLDEVKIELTNYCKRGCIHCSSNANMNDIIELDFEKVRNIIDQCYDMNVKSIVLTGGEATEYKDIDLVVEYIKRKGIKSIKLYTMCEPTKEKYEQLKHLTELGLSEIIYSLTISLTTDKKVTFDNVEEFLIKLSNITTISFHYCLTTKTIDDFDKLDNILSKLNQDHFKSLSFLRYVEHGRGNDKLTLSSNALKQLKPKIIKMFEKYQSKIHLGSPFNILDITYTPCTAGSKTMIIGFDGTVYPCDAMKYFNYMGSGGNIYDSGLIDIYNSNYFEEIRKMSKNVNDECQNCVNINCKSGCLGQKMLDIIKKSDSVITTEWYQENALRTINTFENDEMLKLNAYTGIIGEYGEFFDYIKKLYTHNLTEEKKEEILKLAPNELGDLIWYLSTSLALYYHYTLDEIYSYIINKKEKIHYINKNLIEKASQNKDPLCEFNKQKGYNVNVINNYIDNNNEENVLELLMNFKKNLNKLDYVENREDVIPVVATIFLNIAYISKFIFNKDLSEILESNIVKLRKRYPEGFNTEVANQRIDANKKYKEEENLRARILMK